jgi:hypothetical protein
MKTDLGNTVYFATLTGCLPTRFAPFPSVCDSLLPCWPQRWSVVSACVSRRRETNPNILCNQIISISTKFRFKC